ncbi:hypothetical protein C5F50_06260 [Nitrosopumilus ureiphilus]|uniref:Uncharacterized protein n=1 Tax=Nitrosopumilus ureiphilus TaxID=1470067 RepID=A0A7D5RGF3_9ARCH|nr:hypothetical protein C5F50_06260 [Nitrosopumilus ureiphilus]
MIGINIMIYFLVYLSHNGCKSKFHWCPIMIASRTIHIFYELFGSLHSCIVNFTQNAKKNQL